MKLKMMLLLVAAAVFLTACGQDNLESTTLLDHNKHEVTFPQDKPTLFFFITSYT